MQLPNRRDIPMKPVPDPRPVEGGNPPFLPTGSIQRAPSPFQRKPPGREQGPAR